MIAAPKDPRLNSLYRRAILERAENDEDFQDAIWARCAEDPIFYVDVFGWTYSPKDHGECPDQPFIMWPCQERVFRQMNDAVGKHPLLGLKSRDMGFTWLVIVLLVWRAQFKSKQSFLLGSRKEEYVDKTGDPKTLFWKALTVDTPVLTPRGWVANGDLQVGDYVIGSDGKPTEVTAVFDHGLKRVFRVSFSDGTFIRCCGDHQWSVTTVHERGNAVGQRRERRYSVVSTEQMYVGGVKRNVSGGKRRSEYQIPLNAPVEFAEQSPLPIRPYLLGVLIGDGCLSKSSIEVCGIDDEVLDRVRREIPSGTSAKKTGTISLLLTGSNGQMSKLVRSLGLRGKRSWEKHIPDQYRTASIQDRLDLLRGLMDTDGYVKLTNGKRGERSDCYFTTTSQRLAKDVAGLVRSLGGMVRIGAYPSHYLVDGKRRAGRVKYHVTVICPFNPFYLPRKAELYRNRKLQDKSIVKVERDGEGAVRCISVDAPDHLYVADGFNLTHNCDYFIENLPGWLQPYSDRIDRHLGMMETGSTIDGESTNDNFARGDRRTAIALDEFPSVENGYMIEKAVGDATNCPIWFGTPNGASGAFYDIYNRMQAENPERIVHLHWSEHPEKRKGLYTSEHDENEVYQLKILDTEYKFPADYKFILDGRLRSIAYDERERRAPNRRVMAQEWDMDFQASAWQWFDTVKVTELKAKTAKPHDQFGEIFLDPDWKHPRWNENHRAGKIKLWFKFILDAEGKPLANIPKDWTDVVIACDIGLGTAGEYSSNSVASIYRRKSGEKIGQYTTNDTTPTEFCRRVLALCHWFNNAYLIWESNGPGGLFTNEVKKAGYRNVYYSEKNLAKFVDEKTSNPGWHSNKDTKKILLEDYSNALLDGKIKNRCAEALDELAQYVHEPNGVIVHSRAKTQRKDDTDPTEAGENHGDMVISDALANFGIADINKREIEQPPETPPPPPGSFGARSLEAREARRNQPRIWGDFSRRRRIRQDAVELRSN